MNLLCPKNGDADVILFFCFLYKKEEKFEMLAGIGLQRYLSLFYYVVSVIVLHNLCLLEWLLLVELTGDYKCIEPNTNENIIFRIRYFIGKPLRF